MAKILIAEDERDIRELIEFTLTAYAGHQVFKAANGAEAVEMAPQVMPDLIMMDVRMPRMTGYEACRELKKIDGVKDIPVVFLSAKGQESEIDSGLDAGAYDYILKPFAPDQLASRVTEILAKMQSAKQAAPAVTTSPAAPVQPAPQSPAPASATPTAAQPMQPPAPSTPSSQTTTSAAAPSPAPSSTPSHLTGKSGDGTGKG